MSEADRDAFQNAVAEKLSLMKRGTFRGDVALKLHLATTSRTAPQAHTIAKNLLDLLAGRRAGVNWPKHHLLYKDDSQVQALAVSCRHGNARPHIGIEARPFPAMLDDLELAAAAMQAADMTSEAYYDDLRERDSIDTYRELVQNEDRDRKALGDKLYEAYSKMVRWSAQRALFGGAAITIPVLSWMYGLPKGLPTGLPKETWAELIGRSPVRIQLGSLPIASGGSAQFKKAVTDAVASFKARWDWVISPLVVAVALEVIIRPSPNTPPTVLHDLDNVVRDYLLPGIVPAFGTVTDHRWTIDFVELRKRDAKLADSWGRNPTPPPGTRSGVTRYEAWRLPAVPGEPGFVSVALLADTDAKGDLMAEIDGRIRDWMDERSDNDRFGRRRRAGR